MNNLQNMVALVTRRKALEEELATIKAQEDELEQTILKEFEENGMSSAKVDGSTVYLRRQLWAKAKDGGREAACQALKAVGLPEFVYETFNTNSLSSYVREREENNIPLPEELTQALDIKEKFSIVVKKS